MQLTVDLVLMSLKPQRIKREKTVFQGSNLALYLTCERSKSRECDLSNPFRQDGDYNSK